MIYRYRISDLTIDTEGLFAMLGFGDPVYHDIVYRELEAAADYVDIRGSVTIYDCSVSNGGLSIGGANFGVGSTVGAALRGSERAALFVCTAGDGTEKRRAELNASGDIVEAFVADMIGSVIVEAAMDKIQENLTVEMRTLELRTTNRYSPGYCGWATAEQHRLLPMTEAAECGITLSDSALMHPVKSVSGVIGIGTQVKYRDYTCGACTSGGCIYRNIKTSGNVRAKH